MEYLKQLFLGGKSKDPISMMGKTYFPMSICIDEYYDLDQVKSLTVKFITIYLGKESVIGFSGNPYDVSQIVQELRED